MYTNLVVSIFSELCFAPFDAGGGSAAVFAEAFAFAIGAARRCPKFAFFSASERKLALRGRL